jgi:hypothetical protein
MVTIPHYLISKPVPASTSLSSLLVNKLGDASLSVVTGLNATACSFYSSQVGSDVVQRAGFIFS